MFPDTSEDELEDVPATFSGLGEAEERGTVLNRHL